MIGVGVLLAVAGLVLYASGVAEGQWEFLPWVLFGAGSLALLFGLALRFGRRWRVLRALTGGGEGGPVRRLRALPGMVRDTWGGRYPTLARSQTLMWLVALVYLVSPIDIAPEFLPLIGVTDDLGVGAWLLSSVFVESGAYLAARRQRSVRDGNESDGGPR